VIAVPTLLSIVQDYLEQAALPYWVLPDGTSLAIRFKGFQSEWYSVATTHDERAEFVFYSMVPEVVPESLRAAAAEYLMRANYGLSFGNFEMDFASGEVRFRTGIDVQEDRLTTALVKSVIFNNWITMDRYLSGLQAVISEQLTPLAAIQYVEQAE
jgi:hypothetical protein